MSALCACSRTRVSGLGLAPPGASSPGSRLAWRLAWLPVGCVPQDRGGSTQGRSHSLRVTASVLLCS